MGTLFRRLKSEESHIFLVLLYSDFYSWAMHYELLQWHKQAGFLSCFKYNTLEINDHPVFDES